MGNDEINSAEQQAEEILKDAYAEARAEQCPQGDECPVHFRVDEAYIEPESLYVRFITYVGDYAVVTEDNPELFTTTNILGLILGEGSRVDRWLTSVVYVGDGAIGDVPEWSAEVLLARSRHKETCDSWEGLQDRHALVVGMVQDGVIDLSEPKG